MSDATRVDALAHTANCAAFRGSAHGLQAGDLGIPVRKHPGRVMTPHPRMEGVEADSRNEDHHLAAEYGRRLGYAGRVRGEPGDDVLHRCELQLTVGARCVDQALWLQRIDREVVYQSLVEVVIAHPPGRRMRDAPGDDSHP